MSRKSTPVDSEENAGAASAGGVNWAWAVVSRPAVIETAAGAVDGAAAALFDGAVAAAREALTTALGRPVAIEALPGPSAAPAHSYGVAVTLRHRPLHLLVMLDSPAVRALVTALTLDGVAMPAPNAPAPVAEPTDSDKGLIEYLCLLALDHVLKAFGPLAGQPVLDAFCDQQHGELWQQKHPARHATLRLTLLGVEGLVRISLAGLDEGQWAAIEAGLANVGRTPVDPQTTQVRLALPAAVLQAEEYAKMAAGDVILLGGPDLLSLPLPGELVTDTHWSLGPAVVTHDTPTYLTVTWTPASMNATVPMAARSGVALARPGATGAAGVTLVQPIIGRASVAVAALRRASEPVSLHLTKDAAIPVALMVAAHRAAIGELVVLGSELGVRVMQMEGN